MFGKEQRMDATTKKEAEQRSIVALMSQRKNPSFRPIYMKFHKWITDFWYYTTSKSVFLLSFCGCCCFVCTAIAKGICMFNNVHGCVYIFVASHSCILRLLTASECVCVCLFRLSMRFGVVPWLSSLCTMDVAVYIYIWHKLCVILKNELFPQNFWFCVGICECYK